MQDRAESVRQSVLRGRENAAEREQHGGQRGTASVPGAAAAAVRLSPLDGQGGAAAPVPGAAAAEDRF